MLVQFVFKMTSWYTNTEENLEIQQTYNYYTDVDNTIDNNLEILLSACAKDWKSRNIIDCLNPKAKSELEVVSRVLRESVMGENDGIYIFDNDNIRNESFEVQEQNRKSLDFKWAKYYWAMVYHYMDHLALAEYTRSNTEIEISKNGQWKDWHIRYPKQIQPLGTDEAGEPIEIEYCHSYYWKVLQTFTAPEPIVLDETGNPPATPAPL